MFTAILNNFVDIDENVTTVQKRDVQEIVAEIKDDGNADKSDNIEKLETHQMIFPKLIENLKTFRYYILQNRYVLFYSRVRHASRTFKHLLTEMCKLIFD